MSSEIVDEEVLRAMARMIYEQTTRRDWHTAPIDPGLDPEWRSKVKEKNETA
jgi:hypothetical protein